MRVVERERDIDSARIPCSSGRWPLRPRLFREVILATCWTLVPSLFLTAQQVVRLDPRARITSSQLHGVSAVADVAVDPQRRVFILESRLPGVVLADDHLQPLGVFAMRRVGPDGVREPVSIGTLSDGRVVVLDRGLARVTVFDVASGGRTLVPRRTVLLKMVAEAMCVLRDDRLLIYGFNAGNRLHVVDLQVGLLRSFAPLDPGLSPMASDLLTQGRVACDSPRDEVLVTGKFLPVVEAFSISTGERVWEDTLTPFRPISIVNRGSSITISSGSGGHSLVSNVFSVGDYRVFQTVYDSRTDNAVADTVVTYVYSKAAMGWLPVELQVPLLFLVDSTTVLTVEKRGRVEAEIGLSRMEIVGRHDDDEGTGCSATESRGKVQR